MSGTMITTGCRRQVHHRLLATVSAAALLGFSVATSAHAADADKPSIWLDVTGQLDQLADKQAIWVPDFVFGPDAGPLAGTFSGVQKPPRLGYDAGAELSFQPDSSDWVFSASVRVGRARHQKEVSEFAHILPSNAGITFPSHYGTIVHSNESHMFTDFEAGKDVGIGIHGADSTLSVGVRIANMHSRTDVHISTNFPLTVGGNATNEPDSRISHKFHGVGPAVAWNASVPLAGDAEDGQLALDWGVNAALLFGRQTMRQTVDGFYHQRSQHGFYTQYVHATHIRRKNVSVPGVGGFAGISMNWNNARLSLGYRADFYFGAIDGGIDVPQRETRGFYGPFASISIGVSPSDF